MTRTAIGDVSCQNCENVEFEWVVSEIVTFWAVQCPPWVSSGTAKKLQQHHLLQLYQLCFHLFLLACQDFEESGLLQWAQFWTCPAKQFFLRMTEIERKVSFCLKSEVNTHTFSIYLLKSDLFIFKKVWRQPCPDLSFVQRLFLAVVVPWNRMSSNIWT